MYEKFIKEYQGYKENEKWGEIIKILPNLDGLTPDQCLRVCGIAARCFFFQGDFRKAEDYNLKASKLVDDNMGKIDVNLYAENLYLYSAINRAVADKLKQDKKDCSSQFNAAHDAISKALSLSEGLNEFIIAKVHFNAGALYHDIKSDLSCAKKHYNEAAKVFKELKKEDDYNRTILRSIRADMEDNKLHSAKIAIEKLDNNIQKDSKTKVHSMQLRGKVLSSLGSYLEAKKFFDSAKELADQKGMQRDVDRLEGLIKGIQDKLPSKNIVNMDISSDQARVI